MPAGLPTRESLPRRESSGGRGARSRILQAARVLFRQRGINATGIAELCAGAQVSKRTLYQHFTSKDEVIVAYLEAYAEDPRLLPEGVLDDERLTPRARLLELFTALAEDGPPFRGCPFAAAAIELADPTHPARVLAAEHRLRRGERLGDLARGAGARQPEQLGQRLALLYDGAAIAGVQLGDAGPAAEARPIVAALLAEAIDQR